MSNKDDELARKAKAERLRKRIKQLTSNDEKDETPKAEQESPREFIERRMKELEEEKKTEDKAPKKKSHSQSEKRKNS